MILTCELLLDGILGASVDHLALQWSVFWSPDSKNTQVNSSKTSVVLSSSAESHSAHPLPEDENQIFLFGFLCLICGIIQGITAVISREHLDKLEVRISFITLQDLTALLHDDFLLIVTQAEKDSLLPLPPLLFIGLRLAHLHLIEDRKNILFHCNSGGLQTHSHIVSLTPAQLSSVKKEVNVCVYVWLN